MNILHTFLSEEMTMALGWTFIHSLWQILLIAIVLKLVLLGIKKTAAQKRYWANLGGMLAVCMTSLFTFYYVYDAKAVASVPAENSVFTIDIYGTDASVSLCEGMFGCSSPLSQVLLIAEQHIAILVGIWLVGFAFFFAKMFLGIYYIEKLKRSEQQLLPMEWQARMQLLKEQVGIRKDVKLVASKVVNMPMMLGFFKPIILLPTSVLTGVEVNVLEAIIAHELAHIARHDFFVNIVQTFVESVFYYHPAIWWMSNNVRDEREKCCDDLAIQMCGDSLVYAKALIQVEELPQTSPTFTLSFLGNKKHLLSRVKRILNQPQTQSNHMEKFIVSSLVVLAVVGMSFGLNKELPTTNIAAVETTIDLVKDTFDDRENITVTKNGTKYELKIVNGEIQKFKINGKKIAPEDYGKYQDVIEELRNTPVPPIPPTPPVAPVSPVPPTPPAAPVAPVSPIKSKSHSRLLKKSDKINGAWVKTPSTTDDNTLMASISPMMPFKNRINSTLIAPIDSIKGLTERNRKLRIESEGAVQQIEIEDGEVFINGKKVDRSTDKILDIGKNKVEIKNGVISIDGDKDKDESSFLFRDSESLFGDDEDLAIIFGDTDFHFDDDFSFFQDSIDGDWAEDIKYMSEMTRGIAEESRQMAEEMMTLKEELKANAKSMTRDRKEEIKEEMEALQELMEIRTDEMREEMEARAEEMQHRAEEMQEQLEMRAEQMQEQDDADRLSEAIESHLLEDGLIQDIGNYELELTGKVMKVSGKKMNEQIHQKYMELYKSITNVNVSKKTGYRVRKNSRRTNINHWQH